MSETVEYQEKKKILARPNRRFRRNSSLPLQVVRCELYCRRCNLAFVASTAKRCQCKVAKPIKQ